MKITIKDLSIDEVNAIIAVIQELPAKFANPLTEKIRLQAMEQVKLAEQQARDQVAAPQAAAE